MASGQRPEFVCPCHTACVQFASATCNLSKVKGGLFRFAFKEGTFIIRWRCASQGFSEKPWLWAKEGSKAKGLGWLASTGRPDMAAPHSIIPSGYDRRSPQLISEVNAAVKQCHAVPFSITIWPIPFAELRWTTFTDSSFDTGQRQRHQQGWLVCASNKYFKQKRTAPVSVPHWRSRKLTRKAGSPQLVETYAASSPVVEMTGIKASWESMTWKDFDNLTQRRSSRPLKTMMPHVIRNENPAYYDPESTLVMDSKSLSDALDNDLHQDDRKSALEVPIIEEFMCRTMCRSRRCPHNRNAADAMTKFKGAHSEPLFMLLRTGMYTLKGENSELADRATLRQTGTVPRHKVSAVKSVKERVFIVHMPTESRDLFAVYVRAGPCRLWVFVTPSNRSFTLCQPMTF